MSRKIICTVILLFPFLTHAQVDKTRVLILGTSHLHQIEGFEPFMLDTIIAKLDAFNFDVIGIEKMPGKLLNDIKSRQDTAFNEITEGFGASYIALADTVQTVKNGSFLEAEKPRATKPLCCRALHFATAFRY